MNSERIAVDILKVAGRTQLCAWQEVGCEAAVHAMQLMFEDDDCWWVHRMPSMPSTERPPFTTSLDCAHPFQRRWATYTRITLFVDGESVICRKGAMQGDPGNGVLRDSNAALMKRCKIEELLGEAWFTDDATGARKLLALRQWWYITAADSSSWRT